MGPATRQVGVLWVVPQHDEPPNKKARLTEANETTATTTAVASATTNDWLTCAVCLEMPSSTPVQCRNGHVLCQPTCSDTLTSCPTCRVAMDPTNPIQCLVAMQAMEQTSRQMLLATNSCCRGKRCTWMGPPDALAAHEEQCLSAARATISELVEQQKMMIEQQKAMEATVELLTERQVKDYVDKKLEAAASNKTVPPATPAGSILAAWRGCVGQYIIGPLEGAIIQVLDPNRSEWPEFSSYWRDIDLMGVDGREWLLLRCMFPGISFLKNTTLVMHTFYHPVQQRLFEGMILVPSTTCCDEIAREIRLESDKIQLSLKQVLVTMQHAALLPDLFGATDYVDDAAKRQKFRLCQVMDAIPSFGQIENDERRRFLSLDASVSLDWRSSDYSSSWVLSADGNETRIHPKFEDNLLPDANALEGSSFEPTAMILASNLAFKTKEDDIRDWFLSANVHCPSVVKPKFVQKGRFRDYKVSEATIYMQSNAEAFQAVERLNGRLLLGRSVALRLFN